jgi:hypothetical protein
MANLGTDEFDAADSWRTPDWTTDRPIEDKAHPVARKRAERIHVRGRRPSKALSLQAGKDRRIRRHSAVMCASFVSS